MNIIRSSLSRLCGVTGLRSLVTAHPSLYGATHLRAFSSWFVPRTTTGVFNTGPLSARAEGSGIIRQLPWQFHQVRTRKRGTEYQPKNIKRKRTHGWIKRCSTRGGIEVLLRRMLKGRKSLSH